MWSGTWSSKVWIVVYSSARSGMFSKNVVISVGFVMWWECEVCEWKWHVCSDGFLEVGKI